MTPRALVVDPQGDWYADTLRAAIPGLEISAAGGFAEAGDRLAETEILIAIGANTSDLSFTPEVAARMPRLVWVQSLISGTDHILRALTGRNDVLVTSTTGIHGPQVSEMAIQHMLMLSRDTRAILQNQETRTWAKPPQQVLAGKTVGIVGLGAIGSHLARLCRAFGMTVFGLSRSGRPVEHVERVFRTPEIETLAGLVDYLVLLIPATPETTDLVGADVFAAMRPTAYLVNLARGAVVDEDALAAALSEGTIAGAGLDVFAIEPLPPESPLWGLPNTIITPHVGGHSDRYAQAAIAIVEPNLRSYLDGRRGDLVNIVERP